MGGSALQCRATSARTPQPARLPVAAQVWDKGSQGALLREGVCV